MRTLTVIPGNKGRTCHHDLISSLPIQCEEIVDGFMGSGMLSDLIQRIHGPKRVIGAEKFDPLRAYYTGLIDLNQVHSDFCKNVLVDGKLDESAVAEIWQYAKDVISKKRLKFKVPFPLSEPQALAILLECGYSHSLRFSKKGYNIPVDIVKVEAAIKNGFRNPVVFRPDKSFSDWSGAIYAGNPSKALFATDPPYHGAAKIYFEDNPKACGLPPIQKAVELGYHQVLAFNNFELMFDRDIAILAKMWDYDLVAGSTNYQYRINNKNKGRSSNQLSMFASEGFEHFENLPSGEWYWFLSKRK